MHLLQRSEQGQLCLATGCIGPESEQMDLYPSLIRAWARCPLWSQEKAASTICVPRSWLHVPTYGYIHV